MVAPNHEPDKKETILFVIIIALTISTVIIYTMYHITSMNWLHELSSALCNFTFVIMTVFIMKMILDVLCGLGNPLGDSDGS